MALIRVCKKCYRPVSLGIFGWECIRMHGIGSVKVPEDKVNYE